MSDNSLADERIAEAVDLAHQFGGIDGAHHKQWVIDQMLRKLLGAEEYDGWVLRWKADVDPATEDFDEWDTGVAP